MWHHRVRALLRLVVLSLLLGLIPPAAMPQAQAHTAAIAGPPAANAAPAATTQATAPKPIASTPAPHPEPPPPSLPAKAPVSLKQNDLARLPLAFVPNAGQTDARVKYQVRGQGGTVFFTPQEVVIAIPDKPNRGQQAGNTPIISATQPISLSVVRVSFDGASANPDIVATDRLPGTVNYLLGNDRTKWQTNLATYAGITYQSLYPGIDVHYDGTDGHLKSTYTIAPGANPNRLRWRYDGAKDVQVDAAGNLKVLLPAPGAGRPQASATYTITEDAPAAWQIIGGQRVSVPVKYAVAQNKSVSFSLGAYNAAYPVTIDPTLTSSRIVGGGAEDYGEGIAVDSDGIYVTGYTKSLDFPPTSGVVQPACGSSSSCFDAFVMKLSLDGSSRLYSTFLGGNKDDAGNRIAVDSNHNAAIVGDTHSPNFPSPPTANAYDRSCGTDEACNYNGVSYQSDVFVAILNATGTALLYSSYFGGQYSDYGNAIAIDGADKIYISGATSSPDFPSVHSIDSDGAIDDGFAAKIDPTQSGAQSLIYSAYLSGNASDGAHGIAVSSDGTAYVVGATTSTDFFKSSGAYDNHVVGGGTVFVRTLQWSQQTLTLSYGYSALIGGSGYVFTHDIAVDQYGSAYIVGRTDSSDFPKSNNAPDTSLSNDEGFITKFRSDGTDIAYSTFLGGSNYDEAFAFTVDSAGKAYIAGKTASPDFYLSSDNLRSSLGPVNNDDAFVTTVYPDGHDFQFSTFLAGEDYDLAHDIAIDSSGNMYITGQT